MGHARGIAVAAVLAGALAVAAPAASQPGAGPPDAGQPDTTLADPDGPDTVPQAAVPAETPDPGPGPAAAEEGDEEAPSREVPESEVRRPGLPDAEEAEDEGGPIEVTTTDDLVDAGDGLLSLREAIDQANAHVGDDSIELAEGATYSLALCDLNSANDDANADRDLDHTDTEGALTIVGAGATIVGVTADRGEDCPSRILHSLGSGLVTLDHLTIRGGVVDVFQNPNLDSWDGGGVLVTGDVVGAALVLDDNEAVAYYATVGSGFGGGLYAEGEVSLSDSEVSGNYAGVGGGVYGAEVRLIRTEVYANEATGEAGGVGARVRIEVSGQSLVHGNESKCGGGRTSSYICFGGGGLSANTVEVRGRSVVFGNRATGAGGGVRGDVVVVRDSVVRDNTSAGTYFGYGAVQILEDGGAGIDGGEVTLVRSTVAGNRLEPRGVFDWSRAEGPARGAGIYASGALSIDSSTISGNRAVGPMTRVGGVRGEGTVAVTNSTISGNTSERGAGAGLSADGTATLTHATVARNRGRFASNVHAAGELTLDRSLIGRGQDGSACQVEGPVTSLGYNVVQLGLAGSDCGVGEGPGDQVGVPWLGLRPLAANGGPTRTHLAFAAAVSNIPTDACSVAVDQRGAPRPQGDRCEAGAVEIADRAPTG